jgi:hypothetical protein
LNAVTTESGWYQIDHRGLEGPWGELIGFLCINLDVTPIEGDSDAYEFPVLGHETTRTHLS